MILHSELLYILFALMVTSLAVCRLIIFLYSQETQLHCPLAFGVAAEKAGFMLMPDPLPVTSLLPTRGGLRSP